MPTPALAELLNPEEADFDVGLSGEVDCFEDIDPLRDADVAEVNTLLIDDPVQVEDIETVAPDDKVVLDGRVYPARA